MHFRWLLRSFRRFQLGWISGKNRWKVCKFSKSKISIHAMTTLRYATVLVVAFMSEQGANDTEFFLAVEGWCFV